MSRSALMGPKLFLTCSTRSTSSSAVWGPTIRSWGMEASATARPRPHPGDVGVERHRDEDRETEIEVEVVRADSLEVQAILEDPQEDGPDERSDHRARSPLEE